MQEFLALIYIGFGYWAHCYLTKNKTYFHRPGQLFIHRLIVGSFLGFILIPVALIKVKFESMGKKKTINSTINKQTISNNCNNKTGERAILVEIKGKVNNPNLYNVDKGTRLYELIELAGGITSNANISNLNRARILIDGECVVVD